MHDVHMFDANPTWAKILLVWGEAGVVAEGNDSKTGDRGATMMFMGYTKCKSDSVRMWDLHTSRVIVSQDVTWPKRMFFKNDASGIIDLDTFGAIENTIGSEDGSDITSTSPTNKQPIQPEGRVTWASPLVNRPCENASHVWGTSSELWTDWHMHQLRS